MPKEVYSDWIKTDSKTAAILKKAHSLLSPTAFISGHSDWRNEGFPGAQEVSFNPVWLHLLLTRIAILTDEQIKNLETQSQFDHSEEKTLTRETLNELVRALLGL